MDEPRAVAPGAAAAYLARLSKYMHQALLRTEQESLRWERESEALKILHGDGTVEHRIEKRDDTELADAMAALQFWRGQTMMYAQVIQAELAAAELRRGMARPPWVVMVGGVDLAARADARLRGQDG